MRRTVVLSVFLAAVFLVPSPVSATTFLTSPPPVHPHVPNASPTWATICDGCTDNNNPSGATLWGREYGAMAYDAADNYTVLFGGWVSANSVVDGTTWVYENGVWHVLATQAGNGKCLYSSPSPLAGQEGPCPTAREGASMAYDPVLGGAILYGGTSWTGYPYEIAQDAENNGSYTAIPYDTTTWEFTRGQWVAMSTPAPNAGTAFASMTYDPSLGGVVMGGGLYNYLDPTCDNVDDRVAQYDFSSLYVLNSTSEQWTTVPSNTGNSPGTMYGVSMAYDPITDTLFIEGGGHINSDLEFDTGCTYTIGTVDYFGDTWIWKGGPSGGWTDEQTNPGSSNVLGSMVYDQSSGQLLLVSGGSPGAMNWVDQWSGSSWADTSPGGPGPAGTQVGGSAAYDAKDGYVILLPGTNGANSVTLSWPPPITTSVSSYPDIVDAGKSFSAAVSVSSPLASAQGWGYTLNWTRNGAPSGPCAYGWTAPGGSSQAVATCSAPGAPGTYGLSLVVTVGNAQPSNAAQVSRVTGGSAVVVYPVMVPSVNTYPAPAWVESGATIYLNGTVASPGSSTPGGDAPYSFGWANLSCRNILGNPNTSHVQCVSGAAGSYNTTFTVKDATGATASTSVSLTVYSPISITKPNWLNQDIDSGTSVTLSALVSGGYPNASARIDNWSGLPSGCTSSNAAQVTCQPTVVSSPYHPNICLNVTDPSGTAGVCGYSTVEPPLKVLSYVSNRSSVDGNQWVGFALTVSGGTGSYAGTSWMISDVSTGVPLTCNGNHFNNSSLQSTISTGCQAPNALSNQTLKADVTAADGSLNGYQSTSLSMPIYPDPYVTQSSASAYSVYNNKTVNLYGAAAMGTGDYAYAWTGLPSGCTSQNVSVLACTPDVTVWQHGSYSIFNIYLWINDSNGYPASWNGVTDSQSVKHPIVLTVYKSPFLLVNNVPGADVGQPVTFTLVYNGAYGTLTGVSWQGLPSAVTCSAGWLITGSYTASDSCQASQTGPYKLAVQVTESKPNTNVTYAWLNVSADPVIGTLTVPSMQTVGQTAIFTLSSANGGLTPYSFQWDLSAVGCTNQTTGNRTLWVSCSPTIAGTHQVSVVAVDANGWNSNIAGAFVTFGGRPTISITPAPSVTESGLYTVFTATVGSGSFNYVWTLTPTAACAPSGSVTYKNCTWSAAGTYAVNLTLTNAAGYVNSTNVSYVVLSNPSGLLKETRSDLDIGQSVRLTTVVAGGVAPYTFTWLNLPGGCPSVNRSSVTCTPTMSGNFSVSVKLSDALGFNATTNAVNFTVVGGPTLLTPLSNPPSIDGGQAVNFTVRVANSSGGDLYAWSGLPSTCPPSTTPTITCTSLSSGSYHVVATVTDSNGLSAMSPTLQYSVLTDPTVKLSGPSGSVDASEPVRFTATAANGTGVYRYAWSALTPFSCPTVNAPTDVCTATGSGTGTVTVTVTDSNGVTTRTGLTVTANPALLVNVTLSSGSTSMPLNQSSYQNGYLLTMKAGTSFTVDGSATGGLPPYSLNVTVNGTVVGKGSNQSSLSATTSIPTVGVFTVDFSVTDSARTVVVQGAVQITGTPMNVTLQAPLVTNASVPVNLTVVVSGGVGPFSYHWAAQDGSFGSVMNNTTTTTPTVAVRWSTPGHYNVSVTVVDGQNLHGFSQTTIAVGNNPLTIMWSAHSPIDANASENVSVTVKGGTAPYTYHWYQQGAPGGDHWTTTFPYSYLEWLVTGTFNVTVTVVDAHGASGSISGVFVVGTGISIRCSPTESGSLVVGNMVTFSLPCSPHGGIPPYTYTWQLIQGSSPDAAPFANGTGPTFTYTFQSSGNYLVIAEIADSTHLVGAQTPPGSFSISSTGGGNGLGALTGSLLFWVVLLPILALVAFLLLVFLMARKKRRSTPSQQTVLMGSPGAELSPLQWAILEHLEGHPLEEQDRLTLAVGNAQKVPPSEVRSAIGLLGPMGLLDSRQNVEDKETRYELTDSGKKFLAKHRAASTPPVSEGPADETAISGTRETRTEPTASTPATAASTPSPEGAKDGTASTPKTDTSSPSGHKVLGEERKATDEANPYQGRVKPEDVNPQLAGKKTVPSELLQPMELQQVKGRGAGARTPPGRSGVDYEAKARELEAKAKGGTPPREAQPERRRLRDHLPRKKEGNSDGKS